MLNDTNLTNLTSFKCLATNLIFLNSCKNIIFIIILTERIYWSIITTTNSCNHSSKITLMHFGIHYPVTSKYFYINHHRFEFPYYNAKIIARKKMRYDIRTMPNKMVLKYIIYFTFII